MVDVEIVPEPDEAERAAILAALALEAAEAERRRLPDTEPSGAYPPQADGEP